MKCDSLKIAHLSASILSTSATTCPGKEFSPAASGTINLCCDKLAEGKLTHMSSSPETLAPKSYTLKTILRFKPFRTLWLAQFVSVFGDFLALFGVISLITFRWHGTAAQVTYLLIAYMLPLAIVSPISGVFVDRWRVKRVMISSDLIRGVLVLLLLWVTNLTQVCAIFVVLALVS